MTDLRNMNSRIYKQQMARKSAIAKRDQSEVWRAAASYKRDLEIQALEEKLGIDGVKPSTKSAFKPVGVIGTTSYSAFKKPTLRVLNNGEYARVD